MYVLSRGTEAQFICGQWSVPVVISEIGEDWVAIRYPLEEPIGPGVYIDLQVQFDSFQATYYFFTLNLPRQFNDLLYLRRVGSRTYMERRLSWRVTIDKPIRMEYGENRIGFEATLLNLSSTGAYFSVEHLLPITNPVRIYLPINRNIYAFNSVIVRKIPPNPILGIPLSIAVRFVNNPIELRNALVYFLWSYIRQVYRDQFTELYPGSEKRPKSGKINSEVSKNNDNNNTSGKSQN